jgi:sugar-specific transcriptional regulator TrmB
LETKFRFSTFNLELYKLLTHLMSIQNKTFVSKLEKSGFTDKEALVYVSLLEMGGAYPSRIATYCGLNRTTVYKILLNLSVRGIVNEIEKKNKLFYQVEKPENILKFAKNRVTFAEDSLETLKKVLPEIDGLYNASQNKPKVTYCEGVDGILSIFSDQIKFEKPYEMLAFSNANELKRFLPVSYFVDYVKTKAKIGITTRGLVPDTAENRLFSQIIYKDIEKKYWPEVRYLQESKFPLVGEITIYGDKKISIVNFDRERMTGIIIEDEAMHKMFRSIFELSWSSSQVKE